MKIFLSHSSRDKPLIREIRSYLPQHIRSWIDEEDLLFGEDIEKSILETISFDSDFVVIFIGQESVKSKWVKKELQWALENEEKLGRTFVLPVILDQSVWQLVEPKEFQSRKYLQCTDFTDSGVKSFAEKLKDELFAWLSRHYDASKEADTDKPKILVETLSVQMEDDIFEDLRKQGAPPEAIEQARAMLQGIPKHALVVRVRNEGTQSTQLIGYGILASQEGKKQIRTHPYPPTVTVDAPGDFQPGDYHEFVTDLERLALELRSEVTQYSGKAIIRGFYQDYNGSEYTSSPVTFDLETLELEWPESP